MPEVTAIPKVSVCIPTYNTARYIGEAIESVLSQDFTDFELVICDDVSTDRTQEICRGYADARIRYIRFEDNAKQAGNFNRCLKEARGEFITILHADDFFLPGFLADRVARFAKHQELGMVFGAVQVVDEQSARVSIAGRWDEDRYLNEGELVEPLLFGCIVVPPSLMVRKACADRAGLFRTDLTWGHDWEWALRLAEVCAAYYVSRPMASYRVHDASGTAEQLNAAKNGYQERRILQDTFTRLSGANNSFRKLRRSAFQALSRRHMYFAEQALLSGRKLAARNNLWYAMLADCLMLARPTFWALLAGSIGSTNLYLRYRALRNGAALEKAAL